MSCAAFKISRDKLTESQILMHHNESSFSGHLFEQQDCYLAFFSCQKKYVPEKTDIFDTCTFQTANLYNEHLAVSPTIAL